MGSGCGSEIFGGNVGFRACLGRVVKSVAEAGAPVAEIGGNHEEVTGVVKVRSQECPVARLTAATDMRVSGAVGSPQEAVFSQHSRC